MAEEVVATFDGPLDSFGINLTIENATAASQVREFGISGRTAKFPVTWESFGVYSVVSGSVMLTDIIGLNTEVLLAKFSATDGFDPGNAVRFTGIDPDFTGDPVSGVRVLDMAGARAMVIFHDLSSAFGEFEPTDDGRLRAVLTK